MPYLNRVTILGHCGRDAEVRTTPNGDTVLSVSVATTEKWKDRGGSPQERTTWHRVEKWKAPDWMAAALTRGSLVLVEGSLISETWEKDGVKREAWKIRADNVLPLTPKSTTQNSGAGAAQDVPF